MRASTLVFAASLAVVALALPGCSSTENTGEAGVSRSERSATTLTPSVSPEFAIDPTARGTSDYDARDVAVAAGNSVYLSMWAHHSDGEIRAARLGLDGTLLDPQGIHVAWTGSGGPPRVVYDGSQFVVIWVDNRAPSARLMAVRVSSTGGVGPEQEVATLPAGRTLGEPASDGTKVLVPLGTGLGIGALFQPGVGSGTEVAIVTGDPSGLTAGSAAFDGTEYLVAYGNPAVQIARLSPAGTGTGALTPLGLTATSPPRIEANGANVAVLSENAGTLSFTVPSSPPATRAVSIATEATNFDNRIFDLARRTDGFWIGYSQIRFGQTHRVGVDTTGVVTVSDVTLPMAESPFRGLATSETQTLLVTGATGSTGNPTLIQGRLLSPSRGPFPVTARPDVQSRPGIAANDSAFLAVWNQEPDRSRRPTVIRGGRVRFDGTVLDPGGITLALPGANTSPFSAPNVGSDGHDFLVAYNDATRASVIPVSGQGVVGTAKPLEPLSSSGSNPINVRLSFDGTNYLAVWAAGGAVVTPAGDTVSTFSYATRDDAAVAFNGTHHLLAWIAVTNPGVSPSEFGIFATRVSTTGTILDAPLSIPQRTAGALVAGMKLVRNGTSWLAAWGESSSQGASMATLGRVINPDLTLGAPRVFSELEFYAAATTSGTTNWFAFTREAGGASDLFGNRAALDGTLLDGAGFVISGDMGREDVGALAFGGGRVLAGYLRSSVPPAPPTGLQARFRVLGNGTGGSSGSSGAGDGGDSGNAGEAGEAGEGGSPGTGGSSSGRGGSSTGGSSGAGRGGSAGSSGSGGLSGEGGEGAASGAAGTGSKPPPDDDGGCGCRTAPARQSSPTSLGGVFLALGALVFRRSRARSFKPL